MTFTGRNWSHAVHSFCVVVCCHTELWIFFSLHNDFICHLINCNCFLNPDMDFTWLLSTSHVMILDIVCGVPVLFSILVTLKLNVVWLFCPTGYSCGHAEWLATKFGNYNCKQDERRWSCNHSPWGLPLEREKWGLHLFECSFSLHVWAEYLTYIIIYVYAGCSCSFMLFSCWAKYRCILRKCKNVSTRSRPSEMSSHIYQPWSYTGLLNLHTLLCVCLWLRTCARTHMWWCIWSSMIIVAQIWIAVYLVWPPSLSHQPMFWAAY